MKKETLEALKKSIEKWDKITKREGVDEGRVNCALCELFWQHSCDGCPIEEKAEYGECVGTPYDAWHTHQNNQHFDLPSVYKNECNWCTRIAESELNFLKSLLPKKRC